MQGENEFGYFERNLIDAVKRTLKILAKVIRDRNPGEVIKGMDPCSVIGDQSIAKITYANDVGHAEDQGADRGELALPIRDHIPEQAAIHDIAVCIKLIESDRVRDSAQDLFDRVAEGRQGITVVDGRGRQGSQKLLRAFLHDDQDRFVLFADERF